MSSFDECYSELKNLIDSSLKQMFAIPALSDLLNKAPLPENRVWDAMGYAINAGGKRLRPILTLAVADLFQLKRKRVLKTACAIELLHTYSLIHDDLPAMDNADLRRGKPTLHKRFDEATAILAGDGLLTLAFGELAAPTTHRNAEVRSRLVYHLALNSGVNGMVGGQMLDMMLEGVNKEKNDLELLKRLQGRKTGALIRFSAMAGAILGEAEPGPLNAVRRFGEKLGLAFQITDDILDVEGKSQTTGKPQGGDAHAGKTTFVSYMGLEAARAEAELQIRSARSELEFAGDRGWFLHDLARYVQTRII